MPRLHNPGTWRTKMKKEIHPVLHKTQVTCACGETFETISTRDTLKVDLCSKCHPYFTGKKKILDKGGRVDRFRKRYENSQGTYQFKEEAEAETSDEDKE